MKKILTILLTIISIELFAQVPVNDECVNAKEIIVDARADYGNESLYKATGKVFVGDSSGVKDLWYKFKATQSEHTLSATLNMGYDKNLKVDVFKKCNTKSFYVGIEGINTITNLQKDSVYYYRISKNPQYNSDYNSTHFISSKKVLDNLTNNNAVEIDTVPLSSFYRKGSIFKFIAKQSNVIIVASEVAAEQYVGSQIIGSKYFSDGVLYFSDLVVGNIYYVGVSDMCSSCGPANFSINLKYPKLNGEVCDNAQKININQAYNYNLGSFIKGRHNYKLDNYSNQFSCILKTKDENTIDVFYKFIANKNNYSFDVKFNSVNNLQTALTLGDSSTFRNMTYPEKNLCFFDSSNSSVKSFSLNNLTIGKTYYVRLEIGSKTPVSGLGYRLAQNVDNFTIGLNDPSVTGVEIQIENQIILAPNPSSNGYFQVISDDEIQQIKVTNTLGESEFFENTKQISTKLKGLLLVELISNKGKFIQKLIVE